MDKKSPIEIANDWYQEEDIARAIQNSRTDKSLGSWNKIPEDVYSIEFARWLTYQYKLAMMKGIQISEERKHGLY